MRVLSDAQWARLVPLIDACRPRGKTPLRPAMRRQPQASWASSAWPPLSTGSSAHAERLDGNTEGTSECLCLSKLAQISRVVHIPQDSNAGQPWYSLLEQLDPLRGQLRR